MVHLEGNSLPLQYSKYCRAFIITIDVTIDVPMFMIEEGIWDYLG